MCTPSGGRDYRRHLKRDGLQGARIGIPRAYYYDAIAHAGERGSSGGLNDAQKAVMQEAISILRAQGPPSSIRPTSPPSSRRSRAQPAALAGLQRTGRREGTR